MRKEGSHKKITMRDKAAAMLETETDQDGPRSNNKSNKPRSKIKQQWETHHCLLVGDGRERPAQPRLHDEPQDGVAPRERHSVETVADPEEHGVADDEHCGTRMRDEHTGGPGRTQMGRSE